MLTRIPYNSECTINYPFCYRGKDVALLFVVTHETLSIYDSCISCTTMTNRDIMQIIT